MIHRADHDIADVIAENLHRSELTALERAEHITEWVKLTKKTTQEQQERVLSQVATKP